MVVTPGISTGYCMARNTPLAARSSGAKRRQVFAVIADAAFGDVVAGAARQHIRQRGLARAIGTHDGMHFAGLDRQGQAL